MARRAIELGLVATPSIDGSSRMRRERIAARTTEMLLFGARLGKQTGQEANDNDRGDKNAKDDFRRHGVCLTLS